MKGSRKRTPTKKYTVTHLCVDRRRKVKTIINILLEARKFANAMRRQGRYINFVNAKGIPLPM